MQSGKLNKVCKVYKRQLETDNYGSQAISYKLEYTTRCSLVRLEGHTSVIADEVVYTYPLSIWVRKYVPIYDFDVLEIDQQFYSVDSSIIEGDKKTIRAHSIDESLINIKEDDTNDESGGETP